MVRGLLLSLALVACGHGTLDEARRALRMGELRRAYRLAEGLDPEDFGAERGELLVAVAEERARAIAALLRRADEARARADAGAQGYAHAMSYVSAALALMEPDAPEVPELEATLERLEELQEARRAAYEEARAKVRAQAESCDEAQVSALSDLFEKRRAADEDDPIVELAVALARRCAAAERYADAAAVRASVEPMETAADAWPNEELAWLAVVEARVAAESPEIVPQAREAERSPVRPRREPTPEPEKDKKNDAAQVALTAARRYFADGDTFAALVTLDDAIADEMSTEERGRLQAQVTAWADTRVKLIEDYVRRGELALRDEKTVEAHEWYRRVLALDPTHEVAQDRLRKLDKLNELREAPKR